MHIQQGYTKYWLLPLTCIAVVWLCFEMQTRDNTRLQWLPNSTILKSLQPQPRKIPCTAQQDVFYLKMPKTGSTSFSNMLYNFGVQRNLVFPHAKTFDILSDFTGHPLDLLEGTYRQHKFNIIATHTILDVKEIRSLMPEGTKIVTSFRHPLTRFQSAVLFFNFQKKINSEDLTSSHQELSLSEKILSYPNIVMTQKDKLFDTYAKYLGMNVTLAHDREYLTQYLEYLTTILDGIIITEHFDESLILLRKQFCWSIKDILYIPMRTRNYSPLMDPVTLQKHRKLDPTSYTIYNYFLEKFQSKLKSQSPQFSEEVAQYQEMLQSLRIFCECNRKSCNSHIVFEKTQFSEEFRVDKETCQILRTSTTLLNNIIATFQYQDFCRKATQAERTHFPMCRHIPSPNITMSQYLASMRNS